MMAGKPGPFQLAALQGKIMPHSPRYHDRACVNFIHMYVYMYIYIYIYILFIYLFVYLFICMYVCNVLLQSILTHDVSCSMFALRFTDTLEARRVWHV